jgi:hypothetical protein
MSLTVELLVVVLLCIRHVTSDCPPDSGIYLFYNGNCYPNGSYFRDSAIVEPQYLNCTLPNSTLNGGEWTKSTGGQVDCNSGNIRCIETTSPASIGLYRPGKFISSDDGLYKCCLPTNCSDPSTNIITAHIFCKLSHCKSASMYCHYIGAIKIIGFNVELPSDITTIPQQLTLHCVTIGSNLYSITFNYSSVEIINTQCPSASCNREVLHSFNATFDNTINITWDNETISSESFSQPVLSGDHEYMCNVILFGVKKLAVITVRGKDDVINR